MKECGYHFNRGTVTSVDDKPAIFYTSTQDPNRTTRILDDHSVKVTMSINCSKCNLTFEDTEGEGMGEADARSKAIIEGQWQVRGICTELNKKVSYE